MRSPSELAQPMKQTLLAKMKTMVCQLLYILYSSPRHDIPLLLNNNYLDDTDLAFPPYLRKNFTT